MLPTGTACRCSPTRNLVLFPGVTIPISLMRASSLELAKTASEKHIPVGIVCQLNRQDDSISDTAQLCQYGVVGDILQVIDLPGNEHTALVRARGKFKITGKKRPNCNRQGFPYLRKAGDRQGAVCKGQ